jgi:hypothetical protein
MCFLFRTALSPFQPKAVTALSRRKDSGLRKCQEPVHRFKPDPRGLQPQDTWTNPTPTSVFRPPTAVARPVSCLCRLHYQACIPSPYSTPHPLGAIHECLQHRAPRTLTSYL